MHVLMIVCYSGKIRVRTIVVAIVVHLGGEVLSVSLKEKCTCKGIVPLSYKIEVTKIVCVLKNGDSYAMA